MIYRYSQDVATSFHLYYILMLLLPNNSNTKYKGIFIFDDTDIDADHYIAFHFIFPAWAHLSLKITTIVC